MTTDWSVYRKCPTCLVATGWACKALSGKVVNGHPDGCEHTLDEPHRTRPLRSATPGTALAYAIRAETRRRAAHADA
jgi:hypothetical protein